MSAIDQLNAIPDISFVEKDVETILAKMLNDYQKAYYAATKENKTLAAGDPVRIWIYAQALKLYTAYQLIDYAAKQNLVKYAEGKYLENIGARVGVKRNPAKAAVYTVQFMLSGVQGAPIAIPKDTRVSPGNNIFFKTTADAEVPAGELFIDLSVECMEAGEIGNEFIPGQINVLVDPLPYVESVSNLDESQDGAEIESDESLRERILLRPDAFSVAGPSGAYVYWAKECNQSILDVNVSSPEPGTVDVRFILKDGETSDDVIKQVSEYLSADCRRPLTDQVIVQAPDEVPYNIDLMFYIRKADESAKTSIEKAVNRAVDDYILWQKSKIGRDINPDELLARIKAAGAKRAVITSPVFTPLTHTQLAVLGTKTVASGDPEEE